MHFILASIFPLKYKVGDSTKVFEDFNEWGKFKQYTQNNKHKLIKELVSEKCDEDIYVKYDWLLSTSWHARYHNHKHDPEIVRLAISYLKDIKNYSQSVLSKKTK
jgi:hypothetical protein